MLSNKVADIICARVHELCNNKVTPSKIKKLSTEALRSVGVSYSKSEYIHNLSVAVLSGDLNLKTLPKEEDEIVFKKLTSVRGIGNWSAKMYLIFVLNRQNILPFEDMAFLQSNSWLYKTKDFKPSSVKNGNHILL